MKNKLLIHTAVVLDALGLLVLSIRRSDLDTLHASVFSLQNLPLAILLSAVCFIIEARGRKLDSTGRALFLLSAFSFCLSSFNLPPSHRPSDAIALLAYAAAVMQFSEAGCIAFCSRADLKRIVLAFSLTGFVACMAAFGYTFTFHQNGGADRKYDVAVVLGAEVLRNHMPSPLLRGRLDAALKLYRSGMTKRIAVTGAGQAWVEQRYLISKGVPDSVIIEEHHSHTTIQQAVFVRKLLVDSLHFGRIAIVTDSWHLPRALFMCRCVGVRAYGVPSELKLTTVESIKVRIHEAGGLQVYILFGV